MRHAARHAAYFEELDAWTEYWDVYRPWTRGRYYFGDGDGEAGLLTRFLPRASTPPVFRTWVRWALGTGDEAAFRAAAGEPDVAAAIREVDGLLERVFAAHFGDPRAASVRDDYVAAVHAFATDALPAAPERAARIPDDDPRASTAGRHRMEGDVMWFAWGLTLDAAMGLAGDDAQAARRALQLAAVAVGCPADFAWRGHRRTRADHPPGDATAARLRARGLRWADDPRAASAELRALYRIREWGDGDEAPLVDDAAACGVRAIGG